MLGLIILDFRFFPIFRTDVLTAFQLRNNIVVQGKIFDVVASNVDFLNAMKNLTCLNSRLLTLSLKTAVSILMFMNLSTPLRMPLKV